MVPIYRKGYMNMKPNNTITNYYRFIGECLIFYLLLVPFYSLLLFPIPFWRYLIVINLSIMLLTFSIRLVKKNIIYVVDFILLLLLMIYLMGFFVIPSFIMAIFFVWRFIVHENEAVMERQLQSIALMLFLLAIDIIFFYDAKLIWIAMIYLVVMVVGYQLSQVFVEGETNIYPSLRFPLWFMGIVGAGSALLFSLIQISNLSLASIWNKIISMVMSIPIAQPDIEIKKSERVRLSSLIEDPTTASQKAEVPEIITWIVMSAFVLAFIGIILFFVRKKVFQSVNTNKTKIFSSTQIKEKEPVERLKKRSLFSRGASRKPTNMVRRKVYQFEQLAIRKGKSREHSETIEEWFHRYGIEASYLDLYQKVRYGDNELTADEVEQFEGELSEIKNKMKL